MNSDPRSALHTECLGTRMKYGKWMLLLESVLNTDQGTQNNLIMWMWIENYSCTFGNAQWNADLRSDLHADHSPALMRNLINADVRSAPWCDAPWLVHRTDPSSASKSVLSQDSSPSFFLVVRLQRQYVEQILDQHKFHDFLSCAAASLLCRTDPRSVSVWHTIHCTALVRSENQKNKCWPRISAALCTLVNLTKAKLHCIIWAVRHRVSSQHNTNDSAVHNIRTQ